MHLLPDLLVVALHHLLFAVLSVVVRICLLLLRAPLFEFAIDFMPVEIPDFLRFKLLLQDSFTVRLT